MRPDRRGCYAKDGSKRNIAIQAPSQVYEKVVMGMMFKLCKELLVSRHCFELEECSAPSRTFRKKRNIWRRGQDVG